MPRRVIIITGTPCVGKTTVARMLAAKLDSLYVNLTDLATSENLILGIDKKRNSTIVNLRKMKARIRQIIEQNPKDSTVIDGHYAANVVPKNLVSHIFVLRRNPVELRALMEKSGFSNPKMWENLTAEILDVCLVDALTNYGAGNVCEIDTSGKTPRKVMENIMDILEGRSGCYAGTVDWIGKLESLGLLGEYLKT
ncbi:MAG TPA: adenylate kinase family protein [Candidatus Acidoferrum sp.]|nr:adenylate kinase family protein [Candidatus Acidoferrum sp.]